MSTPTDPSTLLIRAATEADSSLILELILELAEYERLTAEVTASTEIIAENLFGTRPCAEVLIAELAGQPIGYALFFGTYSTFTGKPGIYLEDIYIRPDWRGRGFGKALLQNVAGIAVERGCARLEWSVLDWNQPAIDFYQSLGAVPLSEWQGQRLSGEALASVARAGG
jgi:GNAT superfamily N-acetyltransferase